MLLSAISAIGDHNVSLDKDFGPVPTTENTRLNGPTTGLANSRGNQSITARIVSATWEAESSLQPLETGIDDVEH